MATPSLQTLTEKHASKRDDIITALIKLLLGLWSGFDRWDDIETVTGMAARSAQLVDSATAKTRLLSRSYLSSTLRQLDAMPKALPAVLNAYPRANTNATTVYQRPVEQFIWARRNGSTAEETQQAFEDRLRAIAEQDIMAAERDEAQRVFESAPKVTGYRRIIHPELSRTGTCGLCVVASSRIYHTSELMPIHGGDNCDVMPITKGDDPGHKLNQDDLKTVYAAAGSTAAEDLVNTRITINEHGELGPVLVKEGDHFRTAREAGRPAYVKPTPATIRANLTTERAQLTDSLAIAQRRYDDSASSVDGDARIALFRSMKFMRERIASIDSFVSKLAA